MAHPLRTNGGGPTHCDSPEIPVSQCAAGSHSAESSTESRPFPLGHKSSKTTTAINVSVGCRPPTVRLRRRTLCRQSPRPRSRERGGESASESVTGEESKEEDRSGGHHGTAQGQHFPFPLRRHLSAIAPPSAARKCTKHRIERRRCAFNRMCGLCSIRRLGPTKPVNQWTSKRVMTVILSRKITLRGNLRTGDYAVQIAQI